LERLEFLSAIILTSDTFPTVEKKSLSSLFLNFAESCITNTVRRSLSASDISGFSFLLIIIIYFHLFIFKLINLYININIKKKINNNLGVSFLIVFYYFIIK